MGSIYCNNIWRPQSLSELTPYQKPLGLTHLGSEASKYSQSSSVYTYVTINIYFLFTENLIKCCNYYINCDKICQ